ncbi:hypothetical protein [Pseudomonas aeruginosa]
MAIYEVVSGGDRQSLFKRFMHKSKMQAISELVDIHLLHCRRIEKLEAERDAALARVAELEMLLRKLSTNGLMQFSTVDEEMAVQAALGGAPVSQAQQLHDLDKQCRDDVARALGLRPSQERGFAWSYLLTSIKSCVKASEDSAQAQHSVPRAWLDVQAERRRQVEAEGWTPEHDDEHSHGQMARAAACYALAGSSAPNDGTAALLVSLAWPWDEQWWKPSTARRDLVKACALALAEIERLDRATATQGGPRDA